MKKKRMNCFRALKISNILFYTGFVLMAVSLLLYNTASKNAVDAIVHGDGSVAVNETLYYAGAGIGAVLCLAGLILAFARVRCPHCGMSLMPAFRLPSSLPACCPACGEKLRRPGEAKEAEKRENPPEDSKTRP